MKKSDKKKIIGWLLRQKEDTEIEMEGKGEYVKGFNRGMEIAKDSVIFRIIVFIDNF